MPISGRTAKIVIDVVADCVSAPRNILNGETSGESPILPYMVVLQGSLAFLAGSYTAVNSFSKARKAAAIGDTSGVALETVGTVAGLAQMSLGCSATTCGSATLAGNGAVAAGAGDAISPSLMTVYGLFFFKSVMMLKHVEEFEKALLLDDEGLAQFLCNQPEANIERILGTERKISVKDMTLVRQLMARECAKTRFTHTCVSRICLLGMVATFANLLLETTYPELAPFLYAIGATLWLLIDCEPIHLFLREIAGGPKPEEVGY